jgi:hypothetical protein
MHGSARDSSLLPAGFVYAHTNRLQKQSLTRAAPASKEAQRSLADHERQNIKNQRCAQQQHLITLLWPRTKPAEKLLLQECCEWCWRAPGNVGVQLIES